MNYNVVVVKGVKTELTFDNVKIQSNNITRNCGWFCMPDDDYIEGG